MGLLLVATSVSVSVSAAPPARREAEVRVVFASPQDAGTTTVTARVLRNSSQTPLVGIIETTPSGASDPWLVTLWQAAFVATQATDSSLLDYEVSLRVGGPTDGASAGLLVASTAE